MTKRKRFDLSSSEAEKLKNEIIHGTFVTEGTMVAFPLCFPGASAPIVADESHITALDKTPEGIVYGGTSGRQTHLFVGRFHGATGAVFDLGTVDDANRCVAICCGQAQFVACVNGPNGGRFIRHRFQELPFDLLQEWVFAREPFEYLGEPIKGEKFVHAVPDASRQKVIASTEGHLLTLDIESGAVEVIDEIPGSGRLAVGSKNNIFGLEAADSLWCYHPEERTLTGKKIPLPEGAWHKSLLVWAKDPVGRKLYTADGDGRLFSFTEEEGFSPCLGQVPLTPVSSMAVTFDGRVFGTCGEGISNLFCYYPNSHEITNLGVAVSVIERRRYGYVFSDAVVGRDGQIIFAEDDDMGHLWLYFPSVQRGDFQGSGME